MGSVPHIYTPRTRAVARREPRGRFCLRALREGEGLIGSRASAGPSPLRPVLGSADPGRCSQGTSGEILPSRVARGGGVDRFQSERWPESAPSGAGLRGPGPLLAGNLGGGFAFARCARGRGRSVPERALARVRSVRRWAPRTRAVARREPRGRFCLRALREGKGLIGSRASAGPSPLRCGLEVLRGPGLESKGSSRPVLPPHRKSGSIGPSKTLTRWGVSRDGLGCDLPT
jgi:hypothetical protein